jgi:ABC-type bacteriocin/lantibiotic exporter with double-glycine peptidase domain
MAYRRDYSPQDDYYADENTRRKLEHDNEYMHSEAGQFHIKYNIERANEQEQKRNEVLQNLKSIYFSNKIFVILIVTIVLTLLMYPLQFFFMAIIGMNFFVLFVLFAYYWVTAKTQVRPEIQDRQQAVYLSALKKAGRRP